MIWFIVIPLLTVVLFKVAVFIVGVFIVGDVNVAFDLGANNPNDVPKSEPFKLIVGVVKDKHDIAFEDVEFKIACLLLNVVDKLVPPKVIDGVDNVPVNVGFDKGANNPNVVDKLVPFKVIVGVIKEFVIVNADDDSDA